MPNSKTAKDERKICDSRFLISDFFDPERKQNKISNQKSQFTTQKSQIDLKHPKLWNFGTLELWNPFLNSLRGNGVCRVTGGQELVRVYIF